MFILDGEEPGGISKSSELNDIQVFSRSKKYLTRLALTLYAECATLKVERN